MISALFGVGMEGYRALYCLRLCVTLIEQEQGEFTQGLNVGFL